MAISAGLEISLLFGFVGVVGLLSMVFLQLSTLQLFLFSVSLGCLVPMIVGYAMRGGLAFQFSGVEIRYRRKPELASRIRCAIRNLVAWLPFAVMCGLFVAIIRLHVSLQEMSQNPQAIRPAGSIDLYALLITAAIALLGIVTMAGCLLAVVNPSRGVPELLTGTSLSRN
jgi:uncharacterized membrane protein YjgN (DUF898 family)